MCLDADANASNGAVVSWVDCNGTSYQTWQTGDWPTSGRPVIINVGHPHYCLSATPIADSTILKLAPCDGSIGQGWVYDQQFYRMYPTGNEPFAVDAHQGVPTHAYLKLRADQDQGQLLNWIRLS